MKNTGNTPIENPKILIELDGDIEDIENENFDAIGVLQQIKSDVEVNKSKWNVQINPHRNVLALEEDYFTNFICIKPKQEGSKLILKWKFISNHFKKKGELILNIKTKLIRKDVTKFVDYETEVRENCEIMDYYEDE